MAFFNYDYTKISANYFKVRNIAWEFLIKNKVTEYPLDLIDIMKRNNWTLISFKEYSKLKNISIEEIKKKLSPSSFKFEIERNYFIAINEKLNEQTQRFAIAHEIGHILLHKLIPDKERLEKEANMFANRILMPLFLIKELKITSIKQLTELCNVTEQRANNRLLRYNKIKSRNKFYTNQLEKQVFENLKPFINRVKKDI